MRLQSGERTSGHTCTHGSEAGALTHAIFKKITKSGSELKCETKVTRRKIYRKGKME